VAVNYGNRVRMSVTGAPGTGTITLNAAYNNAYATFAEAGITTGQVVPYFIEDGLDFECGNGTYTNAGTTLSRDTVHLSKIAGTAGTSKLNLTAQAVVYLSPNAEDLANVIVQSLQTTYTANTNLTVVIPKDDTTPTSSEGTQVLSQAITPFTANSKILCLVTVWGSAAQGTPDVDGFTTALFRGTTCINAMFVDSTENDATQYEVKIVDSAMTYTDSPATASSVTYSVRVGGSTGATMRLNGSTTARLFGGISSCSLTLLELRS